MEKIRTIASNINCISYFLLVLFFNASCVSKNDIKEVVEEIPESIIQVIVPEKIIIEEEIIKVIPEPVIEISKIKIPTLEEVYLSTVGVREETGKNDGPEVEMYLAHVGLGKGYAWCSAHVAWCLSQAEIKHTVNAWSPTAENRNRIIYKKKEIEPLQPGDVFTLYYTSLKRIGHAGFYHRTINSSMYQTVEGNTNDAGSREGDGVYMKIRSFNATHSISRWE